ncbi:MAG: M36 family metallopeptidase [Verrucomicrobia bacterium]|nr:M36 family metallopeptidase [Verrucomicrobiota bacterium]
MNTTSAHRWLCFSLLACILLPDISARAGQPGGGAPENVDRRRPAPGALRMGAADREVRLRERVPGVRLERHALTGSPQWLGAPDRFLTEPEDVAGAAPKAARAGDPHRVVKSFVDEHRELFGHGATMLEAAHVNRDSVGEHNGLRTTVWEQRYAGIGVFEGVFLAHVTKRGELVNISSQFLSDPASAATRGHKGQAKVAPLLTPLQALASALTNLGLTLPEGDIATAVEEPEGSERRQHWRGGGLEGDARLRLVWLPLDSDTARLAWEVIFTPRVLHRMFQTVVDAETGEVSVRRNLTVDISNITLRVFTNSSPTPLWPGYSAPGNNSQPPVVARTLVTLKALDTNASPNGWINDGINETRGNNVDAHTDLDDDNVADTPRPQGSPSRVFDFPLDLSQAPGTFRKAAVVNLFYWNNWMHDRLYQLGFTEAAGNFQNSNFGRGGLGNDAVQADAQDGGGFNNANFGTPPDGEAPRMQMYLWDSPTPDRDGDFDATVIVHEYVHGLSSRLVGGGVGISQLQAGGMGEGWSDFYALALLVPPTASLNAIYPAGAYAIYHYDDFGGKLTNNDNYYFGLRRYPYATNLAANPLTFAEIDVNVTHPGVPRSPLWMGSSAHEVHNMGEVWCVMLWEARANLIGKYGATTGNNLILQLVTDGMKLSPPNPTFVEARDAILQADQVNNAGANRNELWAAFAKRGLGIGAVAPPRNSSLNPQEDFSMPDTLRVSPVGSVAVLGYYGGAFNPATTPYVLSNASAASVSWTAKAESPLQVSLTGGTLAAHAKQTVNVTLNNAAANTLPAGDYAATVRFSNAVTHVTQERRFSLEVRESLWLEPSSTWDDNETLVGPEGGPFVLDQFSPVILRNRSSQAVPWIALMPEGFTVTPSSGTLAASSAVALTLGASAAANFLPVGNYTNVLTVSNRVTGAIQSRAVELRVRNGTYLTEFYDGILHPFDIPFTTLTYMPDDSPAGYTVCRTPAPSFPTSPTGGTELLRNAYTYDEHTEIVLSGGKKVILYGVKTNRFFVNFNGSITFGGPSGLEYYMTSHYFDLPRIAPLYDYYSEYGTEDVGGVISWRQLNDRVAVTWQNMKTGSAKPEVNSFQAEMFFDGTIRMTILNATNTEGAVGLSRGAGYPGDFIDTDFSAEPDCTAVQPSLYLTAPSPVVEGQFERLSPGRVRILSPRPVNLVVTLGSSDTTEITVPPNVTIPTGSTSAVFTVSIGNDNLRDGTKYVTLTANAAFFKTAYASIAVNDNETTALHLQLPASLTEGANYSQGKVFTTVPVGDDVVVSLTATPPGQLLFAGLGGLAVIPAGQTSAVVQVKAVDNAQFDGTRSATVTASVANWTSAHATVQVRDNENTNLTLLSGLFMLEGSGLLSNAAVVGISGKLPTNVVVDITSDNLFAIWPLGPVTIPAGQTNAWFSLFVWDNIFIDPLRFVTLSASAPGFSNGLWGVFLFDNDGPPTALSPSPAHLADDVPLTADLAWGPKEGELIVNGGFESGLANWTRDDVGAGGWVTANSIYNPVGNEGPQPPLAGSSSALCQQYGNGRHVLWQEVAVPASAWPVQLTWAQRVHNHGPSFATNQQFRVEIRDATNGVLWVPYSTATNDALLTDWTNRTVDLFAFRGQTVRIAFVEEDTLGALNVSLDNVSLVATPPAPTSWLVYFGTNATPGAAQFLGSTTNNSWSLGTLAVGTTYYWQVKSVRAGATNNGPVWQFATIDSANRPPTLGIGSPGAFAIYRAPTNVLISFRTLSDDGAVANVEFYGDGAKLGQVSGSPWSFTWTNPVPGEHFIRAVAQDNGGLRATSTVVYITMLPPSGAVMAVVPFGSTWRYNDTGANLGTTWNGNGLFFSDSSWPQGPAQLGYGKPRQATTVNYGPDYNHKYVTTYFRRNIGSAPSAQNLILRVLRDDGVAVYLNGREVLRNNLSRTADYQTLAATDVSGLAETMLVSTTISPTNLSGRANLLAAEVHQSSPSSPDLAFGLELSAVMNPKPIVSLTAPLPNALIVQPATVTLTASASDPYGAVSSMEFFINGASRGIVTSPPYSLVWSNAPAGPFLLKAVATDDLGTTNESATVSINVVGASPSVAIGYGGSLLDVSWPVGIGAYRVETSTNLSPPVDWTPWTNSVPVLTNGLMHLPVSLGAEPQRFFRLTAP